MFKLILLFSVILNFSYFELFERVIAQFFPKDFLPFSGTVRSLILYLIILFFLYTQTGQRFVAFFAKGRNAIGREEKILEPIIEQLKDRTDIRGYSTPVAIQLKILNAINNLTFKKIKPLDIKINRMKYEYLTGTVKIFVFDSLDIESNSYGNSIFISKGAIDTLEKGELMALVYNEFAQIKYNIANKRLLHDFSIILGRTSAILSVILAPLTVFFNFIKNAINYSRGFSSMGGTLTSLNLTLITLLFSILRLVAWGLTKNYTNAPYMLYERKIFIDADRATHTAGFSADMLSYLDKLYMFKLQEKDFTKLFVELRPLVAYRINYYENVLGYNRNLSVDNYAWSSNYMERVQTLNYNKK